MPFALRRASFELVITREREPVLLQQQVTYHGTVERDGTVRQTMEQLLKKRNHHYRLAGIDYLVSSARRWRYVASEDGGTSTKVRSNTKIINLKTSSFKLQIVL